MSVGKNLLCLEKKTASFLQSVVFESRKQTQKPNLDVSCKLHEEGFCLLFALFLIEKVIMLRIKRTAEALARHSNKSQRIR